MPNYRSDDVRNAIKAFAHRAGIGLAASAKRIADELGCSQATLYRRLKLPIFQLDPHVASTLELPTITEEGSRCRLYRRRVPATRSVFVNAERSRCIPLPPAHTVTFLRAETWHWGVDPLDTLEEIVRTLPFLHFTELLDLGSPHPEATALASLDEYLVYVTRHIIESYGVVDLAPAPGSQTFEDLLQIAEAGLGVAQTRYPRFHGCLRIPAHVYRLGDYVATVKADVVARGLPLIVDLTRGGPWQLEGPAFWKRVLGRQLRHQRFFTGLVEGPFFDVRGARHIVIPDSFPCRKAYPGALILLPGRFDGTDFNITEDPVPFCRYGAHYTNNSHSDYWLWPCIQDGRAADNARDGYCRFVCRVSAPQAHREAID